MFCSLYDKGVIHINFLQPQWVLRVLDLKSSIYKLATIGLSRECMAADSSCSKNCSLNKKYVLFMWLFIDVLIMFLSVLDYVYV